MTRLRYLGTILPLLLVFAGTAHSGAIEGEIVIRRKLTKRSVTPAVSAYARGPAVEGPPADGEDPLAFERKHVVIFIEGEREAPRTEATLEQQNRRFSPDLVVVPVGSSVRFPNRDVIFHNVFSLSKTKSFDLGNYPKGQTRSVTFAQPGIVYVNCHLHPNMSAAIFVAPNAWFTMADASGRFALPGLPPGRYTVVAWHKAAGFFRQNVEVRNEPAKVSFLIPFAEDGSRLTTAKR